MQYTDISWHTRQGITKAEFDGLHNRIINELDYDSVKTLIVRHFAGQKNKGKIKTELLRTAALVERKHREFNGSAKAFEKLVKQVKKDITEVKTVPVTLPYYFWPIHGTAYEITTKKGFYRFTVPANTVIDLQPLSPGLT